ncbi:MAG: extracellular solute-binding protein [Lachnospiraceae bacterium]|nr:extracellular solute-binding protein [Lachnospiraceae bacterium]
MELTLYCMADDVNIDQYIAGFKTQYKNVTVKKTTFDDSAQMDETIKTELNAGQGPDIIIFTSQNGLDVLGMAKKGAFLALDDKMAEDVLLEEADYLPGTFEAGKVNGAQYVLPLSFAIPFLTYDKTADLGFEPEAVISFEEYCNAIVTDIERLKDNKNYATLYCQKYSRAVVEAAQVFEVSREDQTAVIDSKGLQMAMDEFARYADQIEKVNNILTAYYKTQTALPERFTFMCHVSPDITHNVWAWENLYREAGKEEMGLSILEKADGSGVSATVSRYGVVTQNAAPYAYEFLRVAMDAYLESNKTAEYGMSLKKENITSQIEHHLESASNYQGIQMQGLTEEMAEQLTKLYDSITEVVIMNPVVRKMCYNSFAPYIYERSKTYEECYSDFEQKLNLYAGE